MNLTDALNALVYLWQNSSPFNGDHALYSTVTFSTGFPLGALDTPRAAVSVAGGGNVPQGLGTYDRVRRPRVQIDVLADDVVQAKRILQRMREAVLTDLNYEGDGETGTPGKGYLAAQSVKCVLIGEGSEAIWDEERRVRRFTAGGVVEFYD